MKSNELLLKRMNDLGRVLTRDEAFDFYVEKVMRNQASCKFIAYGPKPRYDDYYLWEIENKAAMWHRMALGSLVLKGKLIFNPSQK